MTTKDTGGPAFPISIPGMGDNGVGGMTLRDYFAAQALAGHLASLNPGSWGKDWSLAVDSAEGAYLVADAMLAERAK